MNDKQHPASDATKAASDGAASVRSPPARIGPYRVIEKLGEGGFGEVYAAEQTQPVKRRVALKILKAGMDTQAVLARFEAERQALALMDHPNIAKVFDAGETEQGRPYFVMELIRGEPITAYCDRQRLATEQRLDLFVPLCYAIQHAHQKSVIHRDIKPGNVLIATVDGQPVPKVIDFGIAKAMAQSLTGKTIYTLQGQIIGTPAYMSPEQAEMSGLNVDTRTDVYSLGVLLYELLTGTLPFETGTLVEAGLDAMRQIIREREPPKPSVRISSLGEAATIAAARRQTEPMRLRRLLHGELDWITMRALEKDPTRRYQSPSAIAEDIHRYQGHEAVVAGPPSVLYRFHRFARRNRVPLAFVTLIFLATVAALTQAHLQKTRLETARERVATAEVSRDMALASSELLKRAVSLKFGNDPEAVVLAARDPTIIIDTESAKITNSNAAMQALFGYTQSELQGMSVTKITAEPERTMADMSAIAQGLLKTVQRVVTRKDGSTFTTEIVAGRFERDGRVYAISIFRPTTGQDESQTRR